MKILTTVLLILSLHSCYLNNKNDIILNLEKNYAYASVGTISSLEITINNDNSYVSVTNSYTPINDTIYFANYLQSIIKSDTVNSNVKFFFTIKNNSGNHIYSYDFNLKQIHNLPKQFILKEINE